MDFLICLPKQTTIQMKDLIDGILSYFKAIKIIHRQKLWGYFFIPGIISVLIFLLLGGIIWSTFSGMGDWISNIWPWEFGKGVVDVTGGILYSLLVVGLIAILFRYIIIICLGPFLSPLSEKIERSINGKQYQLSGVSTNAKIMWRGVRMALLLIMFELAVTLPLYILLIIPGAAVILTPLIFIIQAYYAGRGNMDFIFERRFGVRQSLKMGRKKKWLAIGNGLVYLFMMLSIIGVFFAPILSVAGLTVELVKRLDEKELTLDEGTV